jgi:hypothetical protein
MLPLATFDLGLTQILTVAHGIQSYPRVTSSRSQQEIS